MLKGSKSTTNVSNEINRVCPILTILCSIWFHHNLLVWKGEAHSPQHVVNFANTFTLQWLEAQPVFGSTQPVTH
ncbi:hypothetical protein PVK06_003346 [Gossypium arboreum]|uniref:Uncharacterized protein n=1 Tax=Gossypium arboreum TaxID=29729 RepID=A0ABR0R668_GOSAR|nr:hypothetical protein PVK06_003346 [Gossypium arboreum]